MNEKTETELKTSAYDITQYGFGQPQSGPAHYGAESYPPPYPPRHADEERLTSILRSIEARLERIEKLLKDNSVPDPS